LDLAHVGDVHLLDEQAWRQHQRVRNIVMLPQAESAVFSLR
jgi:hypothetical protein